MPILNYTTSIDFDRTISEIQKCLRELGVANATALYENKLPVGLTFGLAINGKFIAFKLPANYQGVLRAMQKSNRIPKRKCTQEQALRVSWRIVKTWVEAQKALIEAEQAQVAEIFLPYAITKTGNTLWNEIETGNTNLLLGDGN